MPFALIFEGFSQSYQRKLSSIPVTDAAGLIPNTFSGGSNNLEHQFVDIDGDEDYDLFFLDSDGSYGWFENLGTTSNAEFEYSFTEINGLYFSDWFYFTDIDDDNDFDYFTGNEVNISLFENTGTSVSPSYLLSQEIVLDSSGNPMLSEFGSNPFFTDIDDDGDYDFFSGNTVGTITFYENIGSRESFNFAFRTFNWQDICLNCTLDELRHGASTIEFADIDDDLDLDLFVGDFFSKSLYFIENIGSRNEPIMDTSNIITTYPQNQDSINTKGFNMPRLVDINSDNLLDMFISVLFDFTGPNSLMFYSNIGTPSIADYQLTNRDFLKTLDVRANSSPTFIDIDADNDQDLFLGSLKSPNGTIHFLENTGSASNPAFEYIDSSFFNIESDLSIAPTFGDLNADNKNDLIIGRFDGTLSLYWNTGTETNPEFIIEETLLDNNSNVIDVGSSASPFLIDMDNDQDLDLIIGGFDGKFNYYKNTGDINGFIFEREAFYFAILTRQDTIFLDVGDNSTPFLFDYDSSGTPDLFSGNRPGMFYHFQNNGTIQNPVWVEITNNFIDENFGGYTAPYFVDIDNDSDADLLLGNVKGGLYLYDNTEISTVDNREIIAVDRFSLKAFPNPFNPNTSIVIYLTEGKNVTIDIYNILGEKVRKLFKGYVSGGENKFAWNGTNDYGSVLPSGNYIILAYTEQFREAVKVTFLK